MKNILFMFAILIMVNACSSSESGDETAKEEVSDADFVEGGDKGSGDDLLSEKDGDDADLKELGDLEGVDENKPEDAPQEYAQAPSNELQNTAVAPAPVETSSNGTYSVHRGDTLMKIAFKTTGDVDNWHQIYEMNKDQISHPNKIEIGQVLKVNSTGFVDNRSGSPYVIKKGDTLASISQQLYGTNNKWKELYQANQSLIKNPKLIFAGFTLFYSPMNQLSGTEAAEPAPASVANEVREPQSAPAEAPAKANKPSKAAPGGDALPTEGVTMPNNKGQ